MSEQRPKQLTTSLVPAEQVNVPLHDYLNSGAFDFVIPVVKYQQSGQEFFYFDVDQYVSLLEVLQGDVQESAVDAAITSLVFALQELEKSGVNIDLVNIFPQYIFLDPASFAAHIIVIPVKDSEPSDFRKFFEELMSVLPFEPREHTKLSLLQSFLQTAPLFTIHALAEAFFNQGADPVMFPDSVLQDGSDVSAPVVPSSNPASIPSSSPSSSSAAQPEYSGESRSEQQDVPARSTTTLQQAATLTNTESGLVSRISHTPFVVGRHPRLADLLLTSPHISAEHARIEANAGEFQIIDLHSTNGVYVNSVRTTSSAPARLQDGDVVTLADLNFKFHIG